MGTSAMEKTQLIKMERTKLKHEFTPERTPGNRATLEAKQLAATTTSAF